MKINFVPLIALCCFVLFHGCFGELKLAWEDDFNGETLDTTKWDVEVNCWGGGNFEKQCYVNNERNIYVKDGYLHLVPIAGTHTGTEADCTLNNEGSCTWTQPATSGRIRTLKSSDGHWKYGKFEIRARLPKGDFIWPAFWMLPTDNVYGDWASSGEIDIMEFRGQDPDSISQTIHYGGQWPLNRYNTSGDLKFDCDFTEGFHVFSLEWTKEALIWSVDGNETYRQSLEQSFGDNYESNGQPFDQRFHLLLNVAIGGQFFDPEKYGEFDISKSSTWTQPFIIDYVKVYSEDKDSKSSPLAPDTPSDTPETPDTPSSGTFAQVSGFCLLIMAVLYILNM